MTDEELMGLAFQHAQDNPIKVDINKLPHYTFFAGKDALDRYTNAGGVRSDAEQKYDYVTPEGTSRYWISNGKIRSANMNRLKNDNYKASDLIDYENFYKAYPEARDIPVKLTKVTRGDLKDAAGAYNNEREKILINKPTVRKKGLMEYIFNGITPPKNTDYRSAFLDTLKHELQHYGQDKDNFYPKQKADYTDTWGTNPNYWNQLIEIEARINGKTQGNNYPEKAGLPGMRDEAEQHTDTRQLTDEDYVDYFLSNYFGKEYKPNGNK